MTNAKLETDSKHNYGNLVIETDVKKGENRRSKTAPSATRSAASIKSAIENLSVILSEDGNNKKIPKQTEAPPSNNNNNVKTCKDPEQKGRDKQRTKLRLGYMIARSALKIGSSSVTFKEKWTRANADPVPWDPTCTTAGLGRSAPITTMQWRDGKLQLQATQRSSLPSATQDVVMQAYEPGKHQQYGRDSGINYAAVRHLSMYDNSSRKQRPSLENKRRPSKDIEIMPGPADYNAGDSEKKMEGLRRLSITMKGREETKKQRSYSYPLPGPGQYDVNRSTYADRRISFGVGKRFSLPKDFRPGPGAYGDLFVSHAPAERAKGVLITADRREDALNRSAWTIRNKAAPTIPGPAAYCPKNGIGNVKLPAPTIKGRPSDLPDMVWENPAPGAYEQKSTLGNGRKASITSRLKPRPGLDEWGNPLDWHRDVFSDAKPKSLPTRQSICLAGRPVEPDLDVIGRVPSPTRYDVENVNVYERAPAYSFNSKEARIADNDLMLHNNPWVHKTEKHVDDQDTVKCYRLLTREKEESPEVSSPKYQGPAFRASVCRRPTINVNTVSSVHFSRTDEPSPPPRVTHATYHIVKDEL